MGMMKGPSKQLDTRSETGIMTVEETARFFQKSLSWVYKNWKELGGRKLGGSLFFPSKEDLYELVFCKVEFLYPALDNVRKYQSGHVKFWQNNNFKIFFKFMKKKLVAGKLSEF